MQEDLCPIDPLCVIAHGQLAPSTEQLDADKARELDPFRRHESLHLLGEALVQLLIRLLNNRSSGFLLRIAGGDEARRVGVLYNGGG